MMTPEAIQAALSAVRDRALAVCADHEHIAHEGRPCWPNRASMIAFFAHSLGVHNETDVWDDVCRYLDEYDACCPGCPAHLAVKRGGDRA